MLPTQDLKRAYAGYVAQGERHGAVAQQSLENLSPLVAAKFRRIAPAFIVTLMLTPPARRRPAYLKAFTGRRYCCTMRNEHNFFDSRLSCWPATASGPRRARAFTRDLQFGSNAIALRAITDCSAHRHKGGRANFTRAASPRKKLYPPLFLSHAMRSTVGDGWFARIPIARAITGRHSSDSALGTPAQFRHAGELRRSYTPTRNFGIPCSTFCRVLHRIGKTFSGQSSPALASSSFVGGGVGAARVEVTSSILGAHSACLSRKRNFSACQSA